MTMELSFYKEYRDVLEYAAKNIPDFCTQTSIQTLEAMNKLFGTDYKGNDLVDKSLQHWQSLLPDKISQTDAK